MIIINDPDRNYYFKLLLQTLIEKENPNEELIAITIKDAQFLAEDIEDLDRLHKIDNRTYSYSTFFARNFSREWLSRFNPDNLTVEDLKEILFNVEQQEEKDKIIQEFYSGYGRWKLLEKKYRSIIRDGQGVVVRCGALKEPILCRFRKKDSCFVRDNGETYKYEEIYNFILI